MINPDYLLNVKILEFLEISEFNHEGHKKFKECFMSKQAGGRARGDGFRFGALCGI
jgi:hypothetical protein